VYDSHGAKSASEKFYSVCRSVYEESAEELIKEFFSCDTETSCTIEEEKWAGRFQCYIIRKTAKKLAEVSDDDKAMIKYLAKKLEKQVKVLSNNTLR
jgi:hypothetical protein